MHFRSVVIFKRLVKSPALPRLWKPSRETINVDFASDDVHGLWSVLLEQWQTDSALAECSIVCCEGDNGWDDYLLLHHFDPAVAIDEM